MENEYLKQIKEALCWNSEDSYCDILNAYYQQCEKDGEPCVDNEGRNIYNLMDSRQAMAAVKGYGFLELVDVVSEKPDWILAVGWDMESTPPKPVFSTLAPSEAFGKTLKNILCSYAYDPMAYPAFFRKAVAEPISRLCALYL